VVSRPATTSSGCFPRWCLLPAGPGDGCVQGHAIHPGRHGRFAAERIDGSPDLQRDLLEQILTVGVLEGVGMNDLEQDPFVARQPLVEDAIPLAVDHGLIPLVVEGGLFLTGENCSGVRIVGGVTSDYWVQRHTAMPVITNSQTTKVPVRLRR